MAHRFTRAEIGFLVAMPLLWAVLLLFHPGGDGTQIYRDLDGNLTAWMTVHLGMLVFIPLMAVAVWLLLHGVEGTAARVSRISVLVFAVFYGAFETLQGLGNGALVSAVDGVSGIDEAGREAVVQDFAEHPLVRDLGVFSSIGGMAFLVAMVAAGLAVRRHAGASRGVVVLLCLAGLLITAHPPPFGPTGLALFVSAVVLYIRGQAEGVTTPPEREPAGAPT